MILIFLFLFLFIFLLETIATPHEQLYTLPAGWRHIGCPPDDQTLRLQISLVHQNISLLQSALHRLSDPDSPCYGKYLDRDEVDNLFKPSDQAKDKVRSWLRGAGVSTRDINMDNHHVSFSTSTRNANKLLNTTFLTYANDDVRRVRTTHYYIPESMNEHIHLISPTTYFGGSTKIETPPQSYERSVSSASEVAESCQRFWTPTCLRDVYNVNDYTADPNSGSRIAWGAYFNGSASYSDVEKYEDLYGIPARNFSVELINGGINNQDPTNTRSHLVDLDALNIIALTNGQLPMTQYSVGGLPPYIPNADGPTPADDDNEPYLALYQYMLSKTNAELPQVITNSNSDDEQTVPRKYAERVCDSIGMLGLRGISVIQTMGGVGPGTACLSNDGKNQPQFTPQFPASCPYITGVGETNQTNPLITWNISSGGFSFYFDRPWYQEEAVETYFNNHISNETLAYYEPFINQRGRASPDLSLQGYSPDNQGLFNVAPIAPSGGTRGNAAWAGLIGLLNDARFRAGLPSMGFLNPWLYKYGVRGLTDIILGGSIGCVGSNIQRHRVIPGANLIPYVGWNATEGWDPATGLGFPDFQKLSRLALDMDRGPDRCPYDWIN